MISFLNKPLTEVITTKNVPKQNSPQKILLKKKIIKLKQKFERKEKKTDSLIRIIKKLEENKIVSNHTAEILYHNFSGLTLELLKSVLKIEPVYKRVIDTLMRLRNSFLQNKTLEDLRYKYCAILFDYMHIRAAI